METYKISIQFAILVFPFIAFLFTLPFLLYEYRKYGAVTFLKGTLIYSFILYMIAAYFMVILPLPDLEAVKHYTGSTMQLIPFQFINDIKVTTTIKLSTITNMTELLKFFNTATVYTVIFNILLTVPFGMYMKYIYKQKWTTILLWTFTLSLFYEITQLSGLYGMYPRPYRLFDVDDLFINTMGGLLGCGIMNVISPVLPSIDRLNEKSYEKGKKATLVRRITSNFVDFVFLAILSAILHVVFRETSIEKYAMAISIAVIYIVIPLVNNSKSIGKELTNLQVRTFSDKTSPIRTILRNFILAYLILFPQVSLSVLSIYIGNEKINIILGFIIALEIINTFSFMMKTNGEHLFFYEQITKTKNYSTTLKRYSNEEKRDIIKNIEED